MFNFNFLIIYKSFAFNISDNFLVQFAFILSLISLISIFLFIVLLFFVLFCKDASLEECIQQAKGEHVPAEQNVELQDEQPNLELPLEDEYVAGAYPTPIAYCCLFFLLLSFTYFDYYFYYYFDLV